MLFSIANHPAMGVPPFMGLWICPKMVDTPLESSKKGKVLQDPRQVRKKSCGSKKRNREVRHRMVVTLVPQFCRFTTRSPSDDPCFVPNDTTIRPPRATGTKPELRCGLVAMQRGMGIDPKTGVSWFNKLHV